MRKTKSYLLFFFLGAVMHMHAEDYPASLFGIKSDGSSLNTRSIQFAIDYIHTHGGGRLIFSVGRYLTGSINLKSNVSLQLNEGATLLGSLNPFDYDKKVFMALVLADSQQDIAITGKGIIEGQGRLVAANTISMVQAGIIHDPLVNDRPAETNRPMLIYFSNCSKVLIKGITLRNSASWVQTYDQCQELNIDSINVDSKAYWNNDGLDLVDCNGVKLSHCNIDAADDGICLKSHDQSKVCSNVLIRDCTIRSSASAIKFGTASYGGFKHVRILNNRVFDTYRSAVALESVDGGSLDDIVVDGLDAINTGNAIFLRIGQRVMTKKSSLEDIHISNLHVEIPSGKPDSGYAYEGPIEDQPRNISPIVIAGLPGNEIENIELRNIFIKYPGGGNPGFANSPLEKLDSILELPAKYPEFSMFRELPAWGMYIRHAQHLHFENISLSLVKKDYRMAIVLDDVKDAKFINTSITGPVKKNNFYVHNSTAISYH